MATLMEVVNGEITIPTNDVPETEYWAPEWVGTHKSAWQDGEIQFDRLPGGGNEEVLQSMIDAELRHNELGLSSEGQEVEPEAA